MVYFFSGMGFATLHYQFHFFRLAVLLQKQVDEALNDPIRSLDGSSDYIRSVKVSPLDSRLDVLV